MSDTFEFGYEIVDGDIMPSAATFIPLLDQRFANAPPLGSRYEKDTLAENDALLLNCAFSDGFNGIEISETDFIDRVAFIVASTSPEFARQHSANESMVNHLLGSYMVGYAAGKNTQKYAQSPGGVK